MLEGEVSRHEVGDEGGKVVLACSGEEAEVAEVDAKDGGKGFGAGAVDELHGGEQRTIAADREEVVEAVDTIGVVDNLGGDTGALKFGA